MASTHGNGEVVHPTPRTYVKIAALLSIITAVEVAVFYIESLDNLLLPILMTLSTVKFLLVAMFYMHLKFDHRLFSMFFVGGLVLAGCVMIALMVLFDSFSGSRSEHAASPGQSSAHGDSSYSSDSTDTTGKHDSAVDSDKTDSAGVVGEPTMNVKTVGDNLQFDTDNLTAVTGAEVILAFDNTATTQQHNWVLVENGSKDEIASAGLGAGPGNNWIPEDARVVASTILLNPGESGQAIFVAPTAGTYQFVCTFPGHSPTMFGTFEVTSE